MYFALKLNQSFILILCSTLLPPTLSLPPIRAASTGPLRPSVALLLLLYLFLRVPPPAAVGPGAAGNGGVAGAVNPPPPGGVAGVGPGVAGGNAVAGAGGGPPAPPAPDPWEALVSAAQLPPHGQAASLSQAHLLTPWETALSPFQEAEARVVPANTNPAQAAFLRSYFDSNALQTLYFLMVSDGHVGVATGLFACGHLASAGTRAFWLAGDYTRHPSGLVTPPKVFRVTGNLDLQITAFNKTDVMAQSLADIRTAFDGDAALTLAPQHVAIGAAGEETTVWKALPVHPKIGALFMHGIPIRDAVQLVSHIVDAIPATHRGHAATLTNWIRAAATTDAAANPRSCLHVDASRVDTADTPALESWHHEVAARWAQIQRVPALLGSNQSLPGQPGSTAGSTPGGPPQPGSTAGQDPTVNSFLTALRQIAGGGATGDDADDDDDSAPRGKRYHDFERNAIFLASGQRRPFAALTDDNVPAFWTEFRPLRGKNHAARLFLEQYLATHWPAGRMQYDFLWTTILITDLKTLNFGGNDPRCAWDNRAKGISLFSVCPLGNTIEGETVRTKMRQYEDTQDNHMPRDRAAHDALSTAAAANTAQVPAARGDLIRAIEFFEIWCGIFFGEQMPLTYPLQALLAALYKSADTVHWTKLEWHALFWALHTGIRHFFLEGDARRFERVVERFIDGEGASSFNLPIQLRQIRAATVPAQITPDGSTTSDDLSTLSGSQTTKKKQKTQDTRQQPGRLHGAPCATQFQADIARAEAAKGNTFKARTLAAGQDQVKALFGSDFMQLLPPGKMPCMRYWFFGKCSQSPCPMAHALPTEPTGAMISAIKNRIKTRCDHIVAHPNE